MITARIRSPSAPFVFVLHAPEGWRRSAVMILIFYKPRILTSSRTPSISIQVHVLQQHSNLDYLTLPTFRDRIEPGD